MTDSDRNTQRKLLLINIVLSDRIDALQELTPAELAIFECESAEELLDQIDSVGLFLAIAGYEEFGIGRQLIYQSLSLENPTGLTGRERAEKTLTEEFSGEYFEQDRQAGTFILVSQAIEQIIHFYDEVVSEYYRPLVRVEKAIREALTLLPESSPAYQVLKTAM